MDAFVFLYEWHSLYKRKRLLTAVTKLFFFPDDDSADDLLNAFDLLMVNCSTFVVHVELFL